MSGEYYLSSENSWNLWAQCDTPFFKCPIETWLYQGTVYETGYVNYILEGIAMRHLMLPYRFSHGLVKTWWTLKHREVTVPNAVYFWWEKGWNY